jgi:hypothetical protein
VYHHLERAIDLALLQKISSLDSFFANMPARFHVLCQVYLDQSKQHSLFLARARHFVQDFYDKGRLLQDAILVNHQSHTNYLLVIECRLVVFDGRAHCAVAVVGMVQRPFGLDLSRDVGDVVEVGNLEREIELWLE